MLAVLRTPQRSFFDMGDMIKQRVWGESVL